MAEGNGQQSMNYLSLRREIIRTARLFNSTGLSVGTSGNLSVRTEAGFLVTPAGVPYGDLLPESIIELDREGNRLQGDLQPSSEWRLHTAVYQQRPETGAIVHVHSPYATGLACTRQEIPAFHYHIARAGGDTIRCAEYATFGSRALAENAVKALEGRTACLLANHGQLALGDSLSAALDMACEVEMLAMQYCIARLAGSPVLLGVEEMRVNLEKFRSYGRQNE